MRRWFKYQLEFNSDGDVREIGKDRLFGDHERSMEYGSDNRYKSRQEFLTNNLERHPRFSIYNHYLRKSLSKDKTVLSVGSGRCANELALIAEGYDFTCSDLEMPEKTDILRLFPELRFVNYNIMNSPPPVLADAVVALSVFYVFDADEAAIALKNITANLKPGGQLIIDWGGAGRGFITYFIDEIVCKYETKLRALFNRLVKRENCRFVKKHQGYRVSDTEIVSLAAGAGFRLVDAWRGENTTEIERSAVARKLLKRGGPRKVLHRFGAFIPYVRMFTFELVKDGELQHHSISI